MPQQGIAITARLTDDDDSITGTGWQWYRGVTADNAADGIVETDLAGTEDDAETNKCDTGRTADCWIEGATSSTYIPAAADATGGPVDDDGDPTAQKLTVVARYTDGHVT